MRDWFRAVACLCLFVGAFVANSQVQAQTRAWLDRDRIAFGETATLNVETTQLAAGAPDYSPLQADFSLSGHTSSRRIESVNGRTQARTLYAVALLPRRDGVIGIPSLRVGNQATPPLALTVTPASSAPTRAGGVVFIESEADDTDPYVQQAVGFVVRLYYAVPLISGQLDQPTPDGASLQRVGEEVRYTRQLGGRRYDVLERRFLLIPERSGPITIPGARFQGQGVGGFFDDLFGDGRRALNATGAPRTLQVRSAPASASQPWLPLRGLRLRYVTTPQNVRAGEAATVVVEAVADGASAAQLPELQLNAGDAAQVFAEPPQVDESLATGRPRTTVTRRFSIVPARAGALRVDGPSLGCWDVAAGASRTATLPALSLQVAPGSGSFAAPAPAPGDTDAMPAGDGRITVPGVQGRILPWALATVVFALLWFVTLMWALHRREHSVVVPQRGDHDAPPTGKAAQSNLKRVLEVGDLGEVVDQLCAMATPPTHSLDELQLRLDDPQQRQALALVQRARWADGDAVAARGALRAAFKRGPRWRAPAKIPDAPLPPLYPPA
jgi:hypothetical protein